MKNNKYKIGLTIHNFENPQTISILKYIVHNDIHLDFIIYHQHYYKRLLLEIRNFLFKRNSKEKRGLLKKIREIPKYNISNINSRKASRVFQEFSPSLIICNTGIIKKKTITDHPDTYLINVHGSQLPKYRGVSNLYWALWNKDDIYVTVHRINNGIDEGDILYQELALKNTGDIIRSRKVDKLVELISEVTCKAIKKFNNDEITFKKQEFIGDPLMQFYSMHPILQNIVNKRN